jgi:uncharacterized BrkB/YihY/UPF0761 family membrane protein
MFSIAGYLTGFYFSQFSEPTALGFSGSIVLLLFLAYLLSSVFLFGAEVTQSYQRLVYDADDSHIVFVDDLSEPRDESEKSTSLTLTALITFVVGLLVGSRRRK